MGKTFVRAFAERGAEAGAAGEPIRFTASTEGVARDGLVIEADGWRLENYRKNPVVLWAHDYLGKNLPIGRADRVEVVDGRLAADVVFDQADEFARAVERKYRTGFLHAVSVGWETHTIRPSKGGEAPRIAEAELLDISGVPVPGDPDALIERELRALKALVEAETEGDGEGLWRETAAAMVAVFRPGPDETDAEREKRYRALLPKYRRLGRTAPEFLTLEELRGLGTEEVRGLFLEGEQLPVTSAAEDGGQSAMTNGRAGAVLNSRNRTDLEEAVSLIQGVLERAKGESEQQNSAGSDKRQATGDKEEEEGPAQGQPLQRILERLEKFGG